MYDLIYAIKGTKKFLNYIYDNSKNKLFLIDVIFRIKDKYLQ